jgi:hypothetical protein
MGDLMDSWAKVLVFIVLAVAGFFVLWQVDSMWINGAASEFGNVTGGNIVIDSGSTSYIFGQGMFVPIIVPASVTFYVNIDVNGSVRSFPVTEEYFRHVNVGDRVQIVYERGRMSGYLYPKQIKDAH